MLLAMQRAVFIKAMPLRALGATAEQAVEICAAIERRVPELATESDVTNCIAAGLGMDLSATTRGSGTSATDCTPVTAGFLQAAGVRFNRFFSRDQSTVTADLVQKFHADLGKGFSLSPSSLHPPPSFEMERCLYYTLVHAGGAPDLTRIFWAEHRAAFQSVPGYRFEGDYRDSPQCSFVFTDPTQDD